jgi:heptosyltransferase-2
MHENSYDVIIDMRSTLKTSFFSLFSLHTPFRIGRKKWYTVSLNYRMNFKNVLPEIDRVRSNLMLLYPLENKYSIKYDKDFSLDILESERTAFKNHMLQNGIDFSRPIILAAVSAKLLKKMWNPDRMAAIISKILDNYDVQIILNYVSGHEEKVARDIYKKLDCNKNIFMNINAGSLRELSVLCSFCTLFFGNEGGTRHIAHSQGIPSFCIVSPDIMKSIWLPKNDVEAIGISVDDLCSKTELKKLTYQQKYDLITVDAVWEQLNSMLKKICN